MSQAAQNPRVWGSQVEMAGTKVNKTSTTKWANRNGGNSRVSSAIDTRVDTAV